MEDYKDLNEKGEVLMRHALSQLADGDIEGFNNSRKQANEYFDLAMNTANSEAGKMSMLYGENRNFGVIMHVITENLSPKTIATKEGRAALRNIIETIKKDRVLVTENMLYEAFTNPSKTDNPTEYVDSALALLESYSKKAIRKSNERLIMAIRKGGLNEMVQIPDEYMDLYETIEDAFMKRGVLSEVDDFMASRSVLVEHVKSGGFGESINESLNDDERQLIEAVVNSDDNGLKMFEECKKNALDAIRDASDNVNDKNALEQLKEVYERVESVEMDDNNPAASIAEMIEIKNTLA